MDDAQLIGEFTRVVLPAFEPPRPLFEQLAPILKPYEGLFLEWTGRPRRSRSPRLSAPAIYLTLWLTIGLYEFGTPPRTPALSKVIDRCLNEGAVARLVVAHNSNRGLKPSIRLLEQFAPLTADELAMRLPDVPEWLRMWIAGRGIADNGSHKRLKRRIR